MVSCIQRHLRQRIPYVTKIAPLFSALVLGFLAGCATTTPPPPTVASVNLKRYVGTWHEIARIPNWFQRSCDRGVTAQYSVNPDGSIRVENSCLRADGKRITAIGRATVVPGSGNSRLRVSFFEPFKGDYWILALDPNYQWALVGHPSRNYLWILSRTPTLPEKQFERIITQATAIGYDPSRIVRTPK